MARTAPQIAERFTASGDRRRRRTTRAQGEGCSGIRPLKEPLLKKHVGVHMQVRRVSNREVQQVPAVNATLALSLTVKVFALALTLCWRRRPTNSTIPRIRLTAAAQTNLG